MGFWRENKTAISIILGSALIAAALYLGLIGQQLSSIINQKQSVLPTSFPNQSEKITTVPSPKQSLTITVSPSLTPTNTPVPQISYKKSDIIAALSQKTGIPEDEINFTISQEIKKEGKILLRGGVSREGEMGGAAFFAVVDENGVKVTFAGQGVPECSEVNPYDYPTTWADYCVDEDGNTVAR